MALVWMVHGCLKGGLYVCLERGSRPTDRQSATGSMAWIWEGRLDLDILKGSSGWLNRLNLEHDPNMHDQLSF